MGGKDLVAVEQFGDLVAAGDARAQQAAHGAQELRVAGAVQARQLVLNLFFAGGEVERQQDGRGRQDEGDQVVSTGSFSWVGNV